MNKGKIAIIGASKMLSSSVREVMDTAIGAGYEIISVDKEAPFSPTRFPVTMLPEVEPICLEPCIETGAFSSKHGKDEAYYSKRIAKRRKKNKNKKTHR